MAHDIVIRNGTIVDGTGGPLHRGDVAIDGDTVTAVGEVTDRAEREIDATGCIVTPGFIDPHTHYDAQLCWDPYVSPSSAHGVTTVVMGLCGFGVAPCPDGRGEYLLRSLEAVEEIPYQSTSQAVPFAWRTWPEYLAYVESTGLALNVAGFVPHSALRYYVMGDHARERAATEDERRALARELRRSIDGGALGVASSRGPNHRDAFGDPVPSRNADDDELRTLVRECRGAVWQINLGSKLSAEPHPILQELDKYVAWSAESGARLTWTPFAAAPSEAVWRPVLEYHHRLDGALTVRPQVIAQEVTGMLALDRSWLPPIRGWDTARLGAGDRAARLERLRDPHVRAILRAASERDASSGVGYARGDTVVSVRPRYDSWVILRSASRPDLVGHTLTAAAELTGTDATDLFCDLAVADDLSTQFQIPIGNGDRAAADTLSGDEVTLIGLGDAGAHVRSITNFSYPTELLARIVRDEARFPLGFIVRRLTADPAEFLGITDRGLVAEGKKADVCVIDLDRLALGPVTVRSDLPGGAERLWRDATGYRAVLVNGEVTISDDTLTGARAGTAIRRRAG
jgi:N-acyl-D-aspartate/D-glutamate deacylase